MFERLLGRFKRGDPRAARDELPIDQPTVGLCFEYVRGIDYTSPYLADAGLDHILKALETRGLRATFSCPAKLCETAPDRIAQIVEAGHEILPLGYADESVRDLTDDAIKQLVYTCRRAFEKRGVHPVGFRAPRSSWDERLCGELARQHFLYNAEHDHARRPYVLIPGTPPLVRLPIRTDDRGLRRSENAHDATVSKHLRLIRKAKQQCRFVCVCFHPWLLAEEMERMEHWESWIDLAARTGARLVALEDALPRNPPPPPPPSTET
ncbi:MAG: polysaccharide deacetylase family protein [Phycisphaerae bacterium]